MYRIYWDYIHTHTHTHIYTHTYIHTHIHIYTHTHIMKHPVLKIGSFLFDQFSLKVTLMDKCVHWKLSTPLIPLTTTHAQIVTFIHIGDCVVRRGKVARTNWIWSRDIKGFFQLFHRVMTSAAHPTGHSTPMCSFKWRIYPQTRNDQW